MSKPVTPIKPIPRPVPRALKTPEPQRRHARNHNRRKRGIPEDAPLQTRREPHNRKRRGTGNVTKEISMSREAWDRLDAVRGNRTRGELVAWALKHTAEMITFD